MLHPVLFCSVKVCSFKANGHPFDGQNPSLSKSFYHCLHTAWVLFQGRLAQLETPQTEMSLFSTTRMHTADTLLGTRETNLYIKHSEKVETADYCVNKCDDDKEQSA